MSKRLMIGVSVCLMHPDPTRKVVPRKTLQFIEQSTAHWVAAGEALPVLIPSRHGSAFTGRISADDYAEQLDGLVLHGGADIWPGHYGEAPLKPEWAGDAARDVYELELTKAFVAAGKPVFGLCRGLQLINVAFGGTLYQDVITQTQTPVAHRNSDLYENNLHGIDVDPASRLAALLPASGKLAVNSIHHQAIKDLAPGFVIEARSSDDGLIEAIRGSGDSYVAAVQWHPEMYESTQGMTDCLPLLRDFLDAALKRRDQAAQPLSRAA